MKCPLCNLEMRVLHSKKVVEEGEPPKVYRVQDLSCMNRKCENHGKVVATIKVPD